MLLYPNIIEIKPTPRILGVKIHPTTYKDATDLSLNWALKGQSRYVCLANVHVVMEAYGDPAFNGLVNAADIITPDGMPLVWVLRRLGYPLRERVYGPTLMLRVLEAAAARSVPVGFLGGAPHVLKTLVRNVKNSLPHLKVCFHASPPFREVTPEEDQRLTMEINGSGVQILFVGLAVQNRNAGWPDIKARFKR